MDKKTFHLVEVAIELAWQRENNSPQPRAAFRHELVAEAERLADEISLDAEDVDEIIEEKINPFKMPIQKNYRIKITRRFLGIPFVIYEAAHPDREVLENKARKFLAKRYGAIIPNSVEMKIIS